MSASTVSASTVRGTQHIDVAIGIATSNAEITPTVSGSACAASIESRAGEG